MAGSAPHPSLAPGASAGFGGSAADPADPADAVNPADPAEAGQGRARVEMVIPLRWDAPGDEAHTRAVAELAAYLTSLPAWVDVTIVDGSLANRYAEHAAAWGERARLLRPDPARSGGNGKVLGALTGIAAARHEPVVLADDDVRHDEGTLRAVAAALASADVVRPANVFDSWPWHARWDGGRSLLSRALAADWPGTFGLRRSVVQAMGGWDADVLFENLEMVRTAQAAGARVVDVPSVLVARRPPSAQHFRSQRVRQAYDDLAQPGRLAVELSVLPLLALGLRRPRRVLGAVAGVVLLAEAGRRRGGARGRVPPDVPLWAPLWVLERGTCVWLALGSRLRGGVRYHGRRLRTAAHSTRTLRRRLAASSARWEEPIAGPP